MELMTVSIAVSNNTTNANDRDVGTYIGEKLPTVRAPILKEASRDKATSDSEARNEIYGRFPSSIQVCHRCEESRWDLRKSLLSPEF